jgi:hypothetical protein
LFVVYGIEIPGIHFQDQKYRNGNVQTITVTIKQYPRMCNHKQYANKVQYKISRGHPKMKLGGTQVEHCTKAKGEWWPKRH